VAGGLPCAGLAGAVGELQRRLSAVIEAVQTATQAAAEHARKTPLRRLFTKRERLRKKEK
jgi:hypothetical protein